ncbi:MAG: hypothetical protein ACHQIO_21950 [Nevskiales bacterium]
MKILMIEDDLTIGRALLTAFKEEGHQAVWVRLAADIEPHLQAESFDAVCWTSACPTATATWCSSSCAARASRCRC